MATPTRGHFHAPTRIHVGLRNKIKEMCLYSFQNGHLLISRSGVSYCKLTQKLCISVNFSYNAINVNIKESGQYLAEVKPFIFSRRWYQVFRMHISSHSHEGGLYKCKTYPHVSGKVYISKSFCHSCRKTFKIILPYLIGGSYWLEISTFFLSIKERLPVKK